MGKLIIAALAAVLLAQGRDAATPAAARLAVAGGEIAYDVTGSGPTVVLLHGAFLDRRSWDQQVPVLARTFRVVRYDIRPFGESTRPEAPYSVPGDLLRLLDHLAVDRAHLVGHSFGGAAALDFALLHPTRVDRLVLAAAPPNGFVPPDDERRLIAPIFAAVKDGDDAIVKAFLAHPMWSASKGRSDVMRALDAGTRRNLAPFRMSFAPYLPMTPPAIERLSEVRAPTLVIVGDRDMPSIQQSAALAAKQIPGARLVVVPGADHALPLGWAEEFNAEVAGFLSAARR